MQPLTTYENFYTDAINDLTLSEALELHYQLNPQFTPYNEYKTHYAYNIIKAHDITHVIFGCDTTMLGEVRVQVWANSAVVFEAPFKEKFAYFMDKDARSLLTPTGMIKFVSTHFGQILAINKSVKAQSKLMTKKWEYFKEDNFMDMTIGQIRGEFGIKILPN
jgi:ubiquinone biosynthesis protein Coq4